MPESAALRAQELSLPPAPRPKTTHFLTLSDPLAAMVHRLAKLRGESPLDVIRGVLSVYGPVALEQEISRASEPVE